MTDHGAGRSVFISYASADAGAANSVVDALEAAGHACWIAPRDVMPGASYASEIVNAIDGSRITVLILSASAAASPHVLREVERCASKRHPIVAVRLDRAPLPPDFEYFLNSSHWLDASDAGVAAILPNLVTAVRSMVAAGGPSPSPAVGVERVSALPANAASRANSNRAVIAIGACAAIAIVGFLAWKLLPPKATPVPTPAPTPVAAVAAVAAKSIAVLPFADLSEKHDQEYLAYGMSEEIINLLAKIPEVRVIGRTSSFQFKGNSEDLRMIGKTLGVAYLVEGSLRRSGNHVRVSAKLIDARDGAQLWSETYDREMVDSLTLQDEITGSVAHALQLEVIGARVAHGNLEAHDAYLRGLHSLSRFDDQGFEEAESQFKRALEIEPKFVSAAEQLARTYCDRASWGYSPPAAGYERARAAANVVLALDPESAVAHTTLACVYLWYDWNLPAAQRESAIAIKRASHDAFTLVIAAEEQEAAGHWSEAVRLCEAAKAFDPLTPTIFQNASRVYLRWGRYAEAESAARRTLQISPTYSGAHIDLGAALLAQGRAEEARLEMEREPEEAIRLGGLAIVYQALHRGPDAKGALDRLVAYHGTTAAFSIAEALAYGARKDEALQWLDRAFSLKDIGLWEVRGDPYLRNLESDPRYETFLHKMNFPVEDQP